MHLSLKFLKNTRKISVFLKIPIFSPIFWWILMFFDDFWRFLTFFDVFWYLVGAIFTKVFVQSSKLVDESQIVNFIMTKNVIFTEILEFSTIFLIYRGNFCSIYKCKLSWITSVKSCFGILSLRPDSAATARRNFL